MSFFHHKQPPSIFVVDDEQTLLDLAKVVLENAGYRVHTFADPELALKEFSRLRPELVLTDYAMGRMSGMDLIRECRRLEPRQKIVLISGTVDGDVFAGALVKPDAFVAKPYQIRPLLELVQRLAPV